jgi:glycosyltransferase involved in cell wall biosynthesis
MLNWLEKRDLADKIYIFVPKLDIFENFNSRKNLKIIKLRVFSGPLKYAFRILYDFFVFPVATLILNPDASIIMANYCPIKVKGKKIVLMRHSYLVDESIYSSANFGVKVVETLRRFLFQLTLRSADDVLVQSSYMKDLLLAKYKMQKHNVHVHPNPITDVVNLSASHSELTGKPTEKNILYVSQFYPHKNHSFLLDLADRYKGVMREENIKIYITVEPNLDSFAKAFLRRILSRQLGDIIINIGKVGNDALAAYYEKACCFFFPSKSETFGNPLVEAMSFGLPIVAPDLGYAKAICENAALYYAAEDPKDAFCKLYALCDNKHLWKLYSEKSFAQAQKFPTMQEWVESVFAVALQ